MPTLDPPHRPDLSFNFAGASVLVVDGDAICIEVSVQILAGFGFRRLHRCEALDAATALVKVAPIDLVLIDPYAYGPAAHGFIRWLRTGEAGPSAAAPILMVTGRTEIQNITAARDCGADFVIAKPFSPAVLLDRILWVASAPARRKGAASPPGTPASEVTLLP